MGEVKEFPKVCPECGAEAFIEHPLNFLYYFKCYSCYDKLGKFFKSDECNSSTQPNEASKTLTIEKLSEFSKRMRLLCMRDEMWEDGETSEYRLGVGNGIEYALAVMERREPNYKPLKRTIKTPRE